MPCRQFIVYTADLEPDYGWVQSVSSFSSHQEAMQKVEMILDPRYAPSPTRVAIYQLVEVVREEPPKIEG